MYEYFVANFVAIGHEKVGNRKVDEDFATFTLFIHKFRKMPTANLFAFSVA